MEIAVPRRFRLFEAIKNVRLSTYIWAFLWFVTLLSLGLNNGVYLCICFATVLLIVKLLFFQRLPGIICFSLVMQWVQVFAFVLWMNFGGFDINYLSPKAADALILSCIGLLLMAFIIHVIVKKLGMPTLEYMESEAMKVNEKKLLVLYIVSTVFLTSIGFVLGSTSGFAQILVSIADFKWIFLLWYGYVIWIKKKNRIYLLYIVLYEFASGFYSYFSSFKEVIFYVIILAITFTVHVKFKQFIRLSTIFVILIPLFLSWSVIKGDYRNFLSQGRRSQTVSVSREQAYLKLGEQFQKLKWADFELATSMSLYRLQYILHFALAMERVPSVTPYQNGDVWYDNVMNVLKPRLLFPDKGIFDASVKTSKFTGRKFAGHNQGAAFSLGYFPDAYVDFGPIGMFFPIAVIALAVGLIYRNFYLQKKLNLFLKFAIINVVLKVFMSFENDGLFLVGRLVTGFFTFYLLSKWVFPKLQKWILKF